MEDTIFYHSMPVQLRFSDMDPLGHVNNSVYFSLYDLAKTDYLKKALHITDMIRNAVVIASINADFISPVLFGDDIVIETAITHLGTKSFTLCQRARCTETGDVKCVCRSVMVYFDRETGHTLELPEEYRKAICAFEHKTEEELSDRN